uniref:Uncharacterized protein n=1 Tax=Desertifilum tharense IPPAS B-1220 TaxID=1781255 RepID=A0ACD5GRQ5_9CYAN
MQTHSPQRLLAASRLGGTFGRVGGEAGLASGGKCGVVENPESGIAGGSS